MGRLIVYIILVIADIFFCVFDIFKGYYLVSVFWALLAACLAYLAVSTFRKLRSGGTGEEKTE